MNRTVQQLERKLAAAYQMIVDANLMRVELPNGKQYYLLAPDAAGSRFKPDPKLMRAIKGKEVSND